MSIWDNVKKFAQPYSDDEYDDYDEEEEFEEEYEEEPRRPVRSTRRSRPAPVQEEEDEEDEDYGYRAPAGSLTASFSGISTGFNGSVLNSTAPAAVSMASKQEVVLFRPVNFNDTSKAADDLRNHKAVVCNMENVDKAMARRVVDFLSGCVYALDGDVKKIAQSAYLFCPHNMGIVGDLDALQSEVENYI